MSAIQRFFWSTRTFYVYHAGFLESNPAEELDYEVVFRPLDEIYKEHLPQISKLVGRIKLEYLRIKFLRGNPQIILTKKDDEVLSICFFARANSYKESSILDRHSYVAGPAIAKKEYRGRGMVSTAVWYFRASPLGHDGLSAFQVVDNFSSQRACERGGLKRVMRYRQDIRFGFSSFSIEERYE
jgi:hypothetical protein